MFLFLFFSILHQAVFEGTKKCIWAVTSVAPFDRQKKNVGPKHSQYLEPFSQKTSSNCTSNANANDEMWYVIPNLTLMSKAWIRYAWYQ